MGTKRYVSGETFKEFPGVPGDLPLWLTYEWLRDHDRASEADEVALELERLGRVNLFYASRPVYCRSFCGTCPNCRAASAQIAAEDAAMADAQSLDSRRVRRSRRFG